MADYKRNMLFILCSLILVTQALMALQRHLKHEYKTGIEIVPLHEVNFLAFTVCPSFEAAYKRKVLENYGTSVSRYRKGYYFIQNTSKSPNEVFQEVTFGLDEIVKSVTIERNIGKSITVTLLNEETRWSWIELVDITFGKCYSLHLEPGVVTLGINNIAFETKLDVYVYLHYPGQFHEQNSRSLVKITIRNTLVSSRSLALLFI